MRDPAPCIYIGRILAFMARKSKWSSFMFGLVGKINFRSRRSNSHLFFALATGLGVKWSMRDPAPCIYIGRILAFMARMSKWSSFMFGLVGKINFRSRRSNSHLFFAMATGFGVKWSMRDPPRVSTSFAF
ncbi:hypothetical protein AVEN_83561-1 [Araneus ventricosus]|uniref:Uncharacterized protein n=1 Tax=Araneus ventricosus TaxID=182803 RepID=A0A4Y2JL39_ARAVE|nr:hypothetical protein AVEN_83561-1 [Araneus ventricosus]